jgi:hypothetical protein
MTFQFNFEVDGDEDVLGITGSLQEASINVHGIEEIPCVEISCEELVTTFEITDHSFSLIYISIDSSCCRCHH